MGVLEEPQGVQEALVQHQVVQVVDGHRWESVVHLRMLVLLAVESMCHHHNAGDCRELEDQVHHLLNPSVVWTISTLFVLLIYLKIQQKPIYKSCSRDLDASVACIS